MIDMDSSVASLPQNDTGVSNLLRFFAKFRMMGREGRSIMSF